MSNRSLDIPISVMKNKEINHKNEFRAYGISPKGMSVGLRYNDAILRLTIIDKDNRNYMSSIFLNKKNMTLKVPSEYRTPILKDDYYVSSIQFVQSYPLWPADSVARGYDLLSTREKSLILLFPAIRLEIADKLCRANEVTSGLFQVLDNKYKIGCGDLKIFDNQEKLKILKKLADADRRLAKRTLECSQGGILAKLCENNSRNLAQKILENHNIATIFSKINQ